MIRKSQRLYGRSATFGLSREFKKSQRLSDIPRDSKIFAKNDTNFEDFQNFSIQNHENTVFYSKIIVFREGKTYENGGKEKPQVSRYAVFLWYLGCFLGSVLSALYGAVNGFKIDCSILRHEKRKTSRGDRIPTACFNSLQNSYLAEC